MIFVYNALLKANGMKYIDVPVVKYMPGTSNNASMTSTRTKKNLLNYLNAYKLMLDVLKTNENYIVYIRPHLNFWTGNLIASEISFQDKIDLLMLAYNLFEIHQKHGLDPLNNLYKEFYEKVYRKEFLEAVLLGEELSINLKEREYKIYEEIKNRDIFVISDEKLYKLLNSNDYSVKLINFEKNCDSNNSINIYSYYSNTDNFVKEYEYNKEGITIKFYDENNFNYLTIGPGNVKLVNSSFNLCFDNMIEFQNYFITELLLKSDKKPFIIGNDEISDINPKIAHKIDNDFSYNINNIKASLKNSYIDCLKDTYNARRVIFEEKISEKTPIKEKPI